MENEYQLTICSNCYRVSYFVLISCYCKIKKFTESDVLFSAEDLLHVYGKSFPLKGHILFMLFHLCSEIV